MGSVVRISYMLLMMMGVVSLEANAQVSASANASVTLITPIAITKTVDMNFGNVAVGTSPGTVELTPAGTRNASGGVTLPVTTGTVTAASFNVTGASNYTFSISLPSSPITLKSGANSLTLGTFTSDPATSGTLTDGSAVLNVGATLTVPAGQPAGTYTSETPFTVTVNYN